MTKTGVATPASVTPVSTRSLIRPRRHADRTPVPTPRISQRIIAPNTRDRLTGSFAKISRVTCWPPWYDMPRQGAEQCSTDVPVE